MFCFCSLQHMFLTQQCLKRELTLDLLEKFHNPEKIKACLVSEDEDMEVYHCLLFLLRDFSSVDEQPLLNYFTFIYIYIRLCVCGF